MKCTWHDCDNEAFIFELPSMHSRFISHQARHCPDHYTFMKQEWDKDLLCKSATYDEQEYLLDVLKVSI